MFFIICFLGIALDLLSKIWVSYAMEIGETIVLIPKVLQLHHLKNYGAAYSILQNKTYFLLIFTGILLVLIAVYYYKTRKTAKFLERLCLSLIFSGGLGNFLSRIFVSYVTDFIDIHIIPVFNIADICVSCGCFLLLFYYIFIEGKNANGRGK